MGSTETDSTAEMHKVFCNRNQHLYAVAAGDIAYAAEIFGAIDEQLKQIPAADKSHGTIWKTMSNTVNGCRSERFQLDVVLPRYAIAPNQVPASEHENIMRDWQEYRLGADMLIATFANSGMAVMYFIGNIQGSSGLVHLCQFPGWWAIGSGGYNASVWLNYRNQHLGRNMRQSILHAFEASRMASSAPTVNDNTEVLIATRDEFYELTKRRSSANAPISREELTLLAKKYGPRSTDAIGFSRRAVPKEVERLADEG